MADDDGSRRGFGPGDPPDKPSRLNSVRRITSIKSNTSPARNPNNPRQAIVWVATDNLVAIPGLARKLPHYRKYSYLGFSGDEPTNIAKGQWPVDRSPMQLDVQQKDDAIVDVETANTTPRAPLAVLPPVFNETRMMNDTRGSHGKGGQTWPRQ